MLSTRQLARLNELEKPGLIGERVTMAQALPGAQATFITCARNCQLFNRPEISKHTVMEHAQQAHSKNCQQMLCKTHTCFTGTLKTSLARTVRILSCCGASVTSLRTGAGEEQHMS